MWAPWNRYHKSDSESGMYVRYQSQVSDTDSNTTSFHSTSSLPVRTIESLHSPPASVPSSLSHSRKRGSSAELDAKELAPPSPSDRFIKLPGVYYNNAPRMASSACDTPSNIPSGSASHLTRCTSNAATWVYYPTSNADSSLSDVDSEVRGASCCPSNQSNRSSRGAMLSDSCAPPTSVSRSIAPLVQDEEGEGRKEENEDREWMKNAWIEYAYPSPELFVGKFCCTWQEKLHNGTSRPCGYQAKKHLLRRHIEAKHLRLRPFECKFCGKCFSQKSNMDIHLNTHTGDTPHKCRYCDMRFRDPARKHRHMIQVHQHHPSRTKGKRGSDVCVESSVGGLSEHDTADQTRPLR